MSAQSPSDVTVLITDMEGSTALTDARGDESAMELLRTHERLVRTVIADHGAREIKSMGDGFMIAFADPASGIACALDILHQLDLHNADATQAINVRMGLNAGRVIEEAGDLYGTTVNAASRIAAKARSGQLLVPDAVRDKAGAGDWRFVDRGLFWLKGLHEQWRLYEATRGTPAPYRPAISEGRTPFVDRESERARLRLHVDSTLDGRGGVVLLAGDPGAGKSRLADEMGAEANGRGMHYFVGRCYEMSQTQPYTPLIEVLEAAERRLDPDAFRSALGERAGEIARLLPQIRRRYDDIPPAADLPAEHGPRYLHASVRDVLAAIAAVRPLCIVWDDLHWADESTILFLEHVAGDLRELPIMIIGTYTQSELTPARPLRAVIESLHRHRLAESFEVGTLRESDVRTLLTSIADREPPAGLVSRLYEETEGNVFFFEEVVRHLAERDRLFDADGNWRRDVLGLDLEVPETLRLTITRRLEYLSEHARGVLTRAALIGRGFGFDLIEDVSDLEEDALLDALDESERARLITSTTEGGLIRFRFAHELIRQTLIGEISAARRQRLRLRVADAMEKVYRTSLEHHATDIAYQLEHAGAVDPARVQRFSTLAGDAAFHAAGYEEALRQYERALAATSSDDHRARAQLLERVAGANRNLGRLAVALERWRLALDAYEAAGDKDEVARVCLDAGLQVAYWYRGREMLEFVTRGLAALGDRRTAERGGLLALWGAHASQRSEYERAVELLTEAVAISREQGDERILGLALYSCAIHYFNYHEHTEAILYGTESIEHLRATNDLWSLANALGYVATSHQWQGRLVTGSEMGAEAAELALRLGNWSAWVFGNRPHMYLQFARTASLDWYESDGHRALELGEAQDFPWLIALGHTRLALVAFWRGRWDDALAEADAAARLDIRGAVTGYDVRLMYMHAYLGNAEEAVAVGERIRDGFAVPGRPNPSTNLNYALTALEAYAVMGLRDEAASLYPVAEDVLSKELIARGLDYRLIHTLAGIGAACGGGWDLAEQHFEEGLRLVRELPLKLEEPECQRFYVRMLLDRRRPGDLERARALGAAAIDNYRRIGMPRHEALVTSMLDSSA